MRSLISIPQDITEHCDEILTEDLRDVYGKDYTDSLSEEEKANISTESSKYGVLEIRENIPNSPYTEAAKALGEALLSGNFEDFESLLDENVEHISYKKETKSGKDKWHSSLIKFGYIGYTGIVSICPHCHKVVEYYPEMRSRYIEPVD